MRVFAPVLLLHAAVAYKMARQPYTMVEANGTEWGPGRVPRACVVGWRGRGRGRGRGAPPDLARFRDYLGCLERWKDYRTMWEGLDALAHEPLRLPASAGTSTYLQSVAARL